MAGAPYAAGGIRETVARTREAGIQELQTLAWFRRREAIRAGITHLEIKSGYALDVDGERRLCELASRLTEDVTFLGAHVVPAEYEDRADAYVDLVCGAMLAACRPHARWIDVFCEQGAFDEEQSRRVLRGRARSRPRAPGARKPARPGTGRTAGRGDGRGIGRPLHLPDRRRHRGPRRLADRGHPASGHRFLDPAAVSRTRGG